MESPEERLIRRLLDHLYEGYGRNDRHVRRMAASVGPCIWQISRAVGGFPESSSTRQIRFTYKGRRFKGRYSHEQGGKLEIVETVGTTDGTVVITVRNLDDAMTLDFKAALDAHVALPR